MGVLQKRGDTKWLEIQGEKRTPTRSEMDANEIQNGPKAKGSIKPLHNMFSV